MIFSHGDFVHIFSQLKIRQREKGTREIRWEGAGNNYRTA